MRVGDVASTGLVWTTPDCRLREAARQLVADEVGALPVAAGGRAVGILSEHDLAQAVADGADLDTTPVEEYMTPSVVEIDAEAPSEDAARRMTEYQIRHLVVMRHGEPFGMISARDILRSIK